MNIILTGFMATGKSKIGKCLAEKLGYSFTDTDDLIEKREKKTINNIFEQSGEEYFRNLETEVAREVSSFDNIVISTGGGIVLKKENLQVLRSNGIIVNLSADFSVIQERLSLASSTRPLLKNSSTDEILERFEFRKKFYDDCDYKITVSNDKTPEEHAQMIVEKLNNIRTGDLK